MKASVLSSRVAEKRYGLLLVVLLVCTCIQANIQAVVPKRAKEIMIQNFM